MKKIRIAILLTILAAAGFWALDLSIPLPDLSGPRVGEKYTAEIEFNEARFRGDDVKEAEVDVEVTVVGVDKMDYGNGQLIRANVRVKNLGKTALQFSHSFAELRDAEGRRFKGKSATDIDRNQRSSRWFINLEPGFEDANLVFFTVPDDALDGDVYFGFCSIVDEDEHQARALIFEDRNVAVASKD